MSRVDARLGGWFAIFAFALGAVSVSPGRAADLTDDMVGQDDASWSAWSAGMRSLEREDIAGATASLDAIAGMNLSDLRLGLMGDRTGTLRLEQWAEAADAPASAKALMEKIKNGRRQRGLAEDGWHFASIGRFDYADANFKALDESGPDPVALLELARANPERHLVLIKLLNNTDVGPSAKRFLEILGEGEAILRRDPHEITTNIKKLAGGPRMAHEATLRLKDSGEYAIAHLLQFLQDSRQSELHPAIIKVIPEIGRAGLNPLCAALGMKDEVVRQLVIDALVKIGYRQPLAYLARLSGDPDASGETRAAAKQAMQMIAPGSDGDVAHLFNELGNQYYDHQDSLRADTRHGSANVWYLREGVLMLIEVPVEIFNDVMAMRCCEEALRANADHTASVALWLASNIRREARLGMDVESDQADPLAAKDGTRPDAYPRSIHFARAAGPFYNHLVLARAFKDRDPGVALGAIAALAQTAGDKSLVGAEDVKQPLVQSLNFPNRQVRIKAALALGRALPRTSFAGSENVIPVLNEAIVQSGRQAVLIVDPNDDSRNRLAAYFRGAGFECAMGKSLYEAKQEATDSHLVSFDVILLASDAAEPGLGESIAALRKDFQTAASPVLVVAKEDGLSSANQAARQYAGVEVLLGDVMGLGDPKAIAEQIESRVARASRGLGMIPLSADMSLALALQSAEVLRGIAMNNVGVFDFSKAIPALVTGMSNRSETLRIAVARALAMGGTADAQRAIAESAMNADRSQGERVAAFDSLAESARRNGNKLGDGDLVNSLIEFVRSEQDLVLRAAAAKALGALDLSSNKASELIRGQYRG